MSGADNSVIEKAGHALVGWVLRELHAREMASRPYAIVNGRVSGQVLYFDPRFDAWQSKKLRRSEPLQ